MRDARGGWTARHWVAALVLVLVSAFMQFTNVRETDHGGVIHGDAGKYIFYAYNIKHHGTFSRVQSFAVPQAPVVAPDKLTLPGYPWFIARFLGEGDPDPAFLDRVERAQAVLGVVSTLLAFLIALRMLPLGWAFAAGALVATEPHVVIVGAYMITEPVFMALLLGATLAFLHAVSSTGQRWHVVACGLLVGLACLVRPQLQVVPWLLLLAALAVPKWRPHLPRVALGVVVFLAVALPWQWRNAHVARPIGEPDLLVTSIYQGSFPHFMYQDDPRTYGYPYRFDPDHDRYSTDMGAALAHVGAQFAAQPVRYLDWYLIGKPGAFLSWSMVAGAGDIFVYEVARSPWLERLSFAHVRAAHWWLHWPLMLLAIATTCVALWRPVLLAQSMDRRQAIVAVAALLAFAIVLHMLGLPLPRYNIPFLPLEIVLAMVGASTVVQRARGKATNASQTPS